MLRSGLWSDCLSARMKTIGTRIHPTQTTVTVMKYKKCCVSCFHFFFYDFFVLVQNYSCVLDCSGLQNVLTNWWWYIVFYILQFQYYLNTSL